jgi:hypothetical protein
MGHAACARAEPSPKEVSVPSPGGDGGPQHVGASWMATGQKGADMAQLPTNTPPNEAAVELLPQRGVVIQHGHRYKLQVAERRILAGLGGKPWTLEDYRSADEAAALRRWADLCRSVGYQGPARWMTDGHTNAKLGKAGIPTVGVTLHSDRSAYPVWTSCDPGLQAAIAASLGVSVDDIDNALRVTVCPHATDGCRNGCVTEKSFLASLGTTELTRTLRNIFTMVCPGDSLTLTAHHLERTARKAGSKEDARWRVNISDDIRWEAIAPGLLELAPKAYTYTKWPINERPEVPGLKIVYSANERWTDGDIVQACAAGRNVAVVLAVPKGKLPSNWQNLPVADGEGVLRVLRQTGSRVSTGSTGG